MDKYTILTAVISVLALFDKMLHEDTKFLPTLKDPARSILFVVLSMVATPTLEKLAANQDWVTALIMGIVSVIPFVLPLIGRKAPVAVALLLVGVGLGGSQAGCAGSLEEAKLAGRAYRGAAAKSAAPPVDCVSIDRAHITWDAVGKGAAFVGGASGIAILPVHDDTGRIALVAGVVGAGLVAVISETVSQGLAAEWARYCANDGQVTQ
jgi:hypothetical protein